MGAIIAVSAAGVALIILVVGLSLLTLNKGYGYKHKIDPPIEKPENNQANRE